MNDGRDPHGARLGTGTRFTLGYMAALLIAGSIAMVVYALSIAPSTRWLWVAGAPVPLVLGLALTVVAHRGRLTPGRG